MPDELVMAMATALTAKGAEAVVAGGKSAIGSLFRLVRDRFAGNTRRSVALADAVAEPDDETKLAVLAAALAQVMAEDPDFDTRVRSCWREARVEVAADRGGVVNDFSGTAHKVVQARDIHGDIRF